MDAETTMGQSYPEAPMQLLPLRERVARARVMSSEAIHRSLKDREIATVRFDRAERARQLLERHPEIAELLELVEGF